MKNIFEKTGLTNKKVEKSERDGRPTYIMISESTYDTDANDLWDAITNKKRLPRWFGEVEGDLRPGGHYQITNNASGAIIQCEKLKGFELTWEYAGDVSWVKVEISVIQQDKTNLRLQHQADAEGEHFKMYGPAAVGVGWDFWIAFLNYYLKTGEQINENAMLPTPEQKIFTSNSAKSWGEETAKAGYDREWAISSAKTTEKFYMGEKP